MKIIPIGIGGDFIQILTDHRILILEELQCRNLQVLIFQPFSACYFFHLL